jgi:hypothetical protein
VQTQFDKAASKEKGQVVRNGQRAAGLFGSNTRDVLTYIDKKANEVEEIDVQAAFKEKIHASKMDVLNQVAPQHNRADVSQLGVFGTHRPHIPMTTQFDVFKKELTWKDDKAYQQVLSKNAAFFHQLVLACRKALKFSKKPIWKGGQEEGSFDARSLWKLPTNMGDDFYEREHTRFENKLAACILVDMSGSMAKAVHGDENRFRDLAIGLSKALQDVHVKHEVVGFHAPVCEEMRVLDSSTVYTRRSNRLEHVLLKDANQKEPVGVMNATPQLSDNSDGEAVRFALKRLKMMRAKTKLLIVISDNMPYLCDTDVSVLDEDLRRALEDTKQAKVRVMGLGFNPQGEEFFGHHFCNVSDEQAVVRFIEHLRVA